MRTLSLISFLFFLLQSAYAQNALPIYKDSKAPIEKRITDLVAKMTLEEKILQLNQYTFGLNNNPNNMGEAIKDVPPGIGSLIYFGSDPAVRNLMQKKAMEGTRLGIPILFGFDVIHGYRTIYPISLAQACSWNPDLVEKACAVAAKEAKLSGIDWTFSPMIDVARDARWGRISEGYGEDPYTNAVFGVATVQGYQGKSLTDPYSIAACLKHFVGYGESEGGRDYRYSDISAQSLWETYLPPYEACVEAGAQTLMSAFNDISGIPATANHYTLTDILKTRWKHDGFVVSDWDAVAQLINQGVATNRKEAGLKAFMAGVEMDMSDKIYQENFQQLVLEKKIPMDKIDDAVSRILRVKFRLGLFDQPYTTVVEESARYLQPESKAIAQQLAAESMVLLKNQNRTLPLASSVKNIAVIGPMAYSKIDLKGAWADSGNEKDIESILEGFQKEFKNTVSIKSAKGCDFEGTNESGFQEAIALANQSDVVIVCLGEKKGWSGENASRSTIALPAIQEKLIMALKKTGKPLVLVLSNGRPLELVRIEPLADAIVEMWQPGNEGGSALAGIISGRINPSAKLSVTFPRTTGQIPVYYNMRPAARKGTQGNYQDIPTEPLYWFGHGLSYTTFTYDNVKLSSEKIRKTDKLIAEVTVTNSGKMTGKETALWFISDPVSTISRPMKELKFFEKKEIRAGANTTFKFEIDPMRDLSYPDANGNRILEAGEFFLQVDGQKIRFELVD